METKNICLLKDTKRENTVLLPLSQGLIRQRRTKFGVVNNEF
jgi:hypothetical protein